MTNRLVSEILSNDNYITLASQVNQFSDAINLLELLIPIIGRWSPNHDWHSTTIERVRRFELEVISKMCGEPRSNVPYDTHGNVLLPCLFYVLKNVEVRGMSNTGCIFLRANSLDILLQQMNRP